MRIGFGTAIVVFAVFAAVCSLVLCFFFEFDVMSGLAFTVMASISGGVVAGLLIPRWRYPGISHAVGMGALVALVSHIPFSILCSIWMLASEQIGFFENFVAVLTIGFTFAFIPEAVLGAVAGAICYGRGEPVPDLG